MIPTLTPKSSERLKVLIISHKEKQCGVYQYGRNIADTLRKSEVYDFRYAECSSPEELFSIVHQVLPAAVIYNYYPSTLPWLKKKIIQKPQADIIHEITQQVADLSDDLFFHYHIAPDPTLLLRNPLVFKTGRLIPKYINRYAQPEVPTIGSFGFGTAGKGFEKLISTVQDEFDEAIIKLHIPFATFADADGAAARAIAQRCKEIVVKRNIRIFVSHNFLTQDELLDFLSQNSINAFFYEENKGRGISSVIDYALAVERPIAITKSNMFRHILSSYPSICIEDTSLQQIMRNGVEPLMGYYREWSEANLIWDYERIVGRMMDSGVRQSSLLDRLKNRLPKAFNRLGTIKKNYWTPSVVADSTIQQGKRYSMNSFASVPSVISFNRILDNKARDQYKGVIKNLNHWLPEMMARKIPEANIQQAFVLDTVFKFSQELKAPRILCVGSYDDTAAAGLKKLGIRIDEIDPVLNYDLNTFMDRPSTIKEGYDIIFSTSVIEHVEDDEKFMVQIAELLAPGGVAILTADFNDQYKPGDCIPREDYRLYTQKDIKERLLKLLKDCSLVDEPQWDCPNPDFSYAGCRYAFATLVFRKERA
jgi:SAM-dependent methyltransferase